MLDGVVYFGSKKRAYALNADGTQSEDKVIVNDFKIPTKNKEIAEQHRG